MNWIWGAIGLAVIDILLFNNAERTPTEGELSRYTPDQLLDKLEKRVTKRQKHGNYKRQTHSHDGLS